MISKYKKTYKKPRISIRKIHYKLFYHSGMFEDDIGDLLAHDPGHCTGVCILSGSIWWCSGGFGHCP